MGGAAAWQFGTHFAGMWAAVAPGAGFAETRGVQSASSPRARRRRRGGSRCSTAGTTPRTTSPISPTPRPVAYSGEIDGQKQAADIMIRFAEKEGRHHPAHHRPADARTSTSRVEAEDRGDRARAAAVEGARSRSREGPLHDLLARSIRGMEMASKVDSTAWTRQWERADVDRRE